MLKHLCLASLMLNILHGVEVSSMKFFETNPDFYPYTRYFDSIPEAVYYVQHGGIYACLICICCFVAGGRWAYIPLVRVGLLSTFEVHHAVRMLLIGSYHAGAITSLVFIPLAYMFWKELRRVYQTGGVRGQDFTA